jgi:hypothetical protein
MEEPAHPPPAIDSAATPSIEPHHGKTRAPLLLHERQIASVTRM